MNFYKPCNPCKCKIMSGDMTIEYHLSNVVRRDMNIAYTHMERHVTTQGEILALDGDCEYCKIYLIEQEI